MNKETKIFIFCIISAVVLFFATSCADDEENVAPDFLVDLATVTPLDNNYYYLTLDNGQTLWAKFKLNSFSPKENQRVYLSYTLLPDSIKDYDKAVKVNAIYDVLTKEVGVIKTESESVSVGDDPIGITSAWIGDGYLNFKFMIKANSKMHSINLVENRLANYPKNDTVYLEFRHNENGDFRYYEAWGLVAFSIRPYIKNLSDDESVNFVIYYKEYNPKDSDNGYIQKRYNVTYNNNVKPSNSNALADITPSFTVE